ncbi:DUF3857 domain-containing protein [Flavobacterium aquidurense]|uniref:Transglutaminase-like superfamily protein n=1 Tax=Flavobacterium aquidurense TaxID=362413 RepID=A0A0Q0W8X6_9FLAO|nr:DUF3857 domain-containing protein [Flavobacterium aquidurense]KQB40810.1 Transglutaminase-like superfamily protein [Flavobacterium aquidurense]
MKFQSLIIIIFLFLGFSKVKAQNYELGKVTIAELNEKVNPKDSTAPATILFKKGKTFYTFDKDKGFSANHLYEFKIKIYKKEGLKWADQKVRFYVGYQTMSEDRLEFSNAVTYNLENGSIVKTKLDNQGTFKKKVNEFWNEKTITLPNVKAGSIIEYRYILKSENVVKLPDFDFQYDIPINYFEYKTDIPEYYIYKPILIGGHKVETDSKLTNGSQSFEDEYNRSKGISYKQISAFYKGKDISALTKEPYVDNIDNYRGSVQHELERVRYPDQPVKDYTMTWEGVATNIFKNENFGKELNQSDFLLEDVKRLLTNVESKNERLNIIFKFIQNKMNWNEVNDCFTDKGVKKAYADQTGNVAEINFILINMLKLAGIDVGPVLVSTIENGVPVYPTRTGFNYVIAAAEIDGKQILLDASHKFTYPGVLPLNVLNWRGRLIKDDGTSQEINLVPDKASKEFSNLVVKIDNLGKIEGKIRIQRTDYDAYHFRIENANKNQDNYLEKLEEQLGDLKISNYTIENKKTNLSDPVIETFSFVSDNRVEIIGNKIFVNPLLFFTRSKNPFTQEVRQMPIYFGYPTQEKFNLNIEIPDGYAIESLPSPIKISSENKEIVYVLNISGEENKIQISSLKEINNSIFAADQYNGLKELFQKMIMSQNEKIVLKKI